MNKETIAAISTGMTSSGIAIVRMSGSDCLEIAKKIFKSVKPLSEAFSHCLIYGKIYDELEVIDEALVSYMKGPKTYTGEDIIEINCHGSLFVQRKILSLCIKNGARPAGPGEFTMRAFMNGKMDLSQCESVMDLISSENEAALKASVSSLSGALSNIITEIRETLIYEIAHIEAALDDPEHLSLEGYPSYLEQKLNNISERLNSLIENANYSQIITSGIDCAIIGNVNVGKSSLLNALCGEDAVIVTDLPGTTRDAVSKKINMGDFTLNIIDTAGLRHTEDIVEKIGIEKSFEKMEDSELILYVIDSSKEISQDDIERFSLLKEKKAVIVLNKSDLSSMVDSSFINKYTDKPIVCVSAKYLTGLDNLRNIIKDFYFDGDFIQDQNRFLVNDRQKNLLLEAYNSVRLTINAISEGMTEEMFVIDLTDAYESLGKILGIDLGDDVIEEVFSKFCIGK